MQRNELKSRILEFPFCILSPLALDRWNTHGLIGNSAYMSRDRHGYWRLRRLISRQKCFTALAEGVDVSSKTEIPKMA
jgi:hypothetical protein